MQYHKAYNDIIRCVAASRNEVKAAKRLCTFPPKSVLSNLKKSESNICSATFGYV